MKSLIQRVKVLPLPSWCFNGDKRLWGNSPLTDNMKTTPLIQRNGYYYDRISNVAWIECNGEAWVYDTPEFFKHELDYIDPMNRLDPRLFDALAVLIAFRKATPEQRKLWEMEDLKRQVRRSTMPNYKHAIAFRQRFLKFCAEHGYEV